MKRIWRESAVSVRRARWPSYYDARRYIQSSWPSDFLLDTLCKSISFSRAATRPSDRPTLCHLSICASRFFFYLASLPPPTPLRYHLTFFFLSFFLSAWLYYGWRIQINMQIDRFVVYARIKRRSLLKLWLRRRRWWLEKAFFFFKLDYTRGIRFNFARLGWRTW